MNNEARILGQVSERVCFGEFELNLRTQELARNGEIVDLAEQPFLVLKALLEEPGQLVSREELVKRLWPANTFVDFEHSLNKAVKRLREALQDSAHEPRLVETLPRRGYRFIGTVRAADGMGGGVGQQASNGPIVASKGRSSEKWRSWAILGLPVTAIVIVSILESHQWRSPNPSAATAPIRSLVVLPLENLSGDVSQDYFTDGITDALITDLGEIGSLRVISRTTAMQYKRARKGLPEIAHELKVDMVVEGTVVRSGDRVRITAQLIQASQDQHLWAQTYERDVRDVLSVQSEVASAIAGQIQVKLTPQQRKARKSPPATNPEAQDAYLRGHYFAQRGTIDDLQKSIPYFQQAIEKEPNAAAYAGLASSYISLGHMMFLPPQQTFPPAKAAALKALELDNSLEEAHTALGNVKFLFEWDFLGAEKEFELAVQLNPNSVRAQSVYASFLNAMGHPNEAIARVGEGLQVDPLSLSTITNVAWELYFARRYDEAITQARKVEEIDANYFPAHVCLGLAYEQKRDFAAAIAELQKAVGFCRVKCYGLIGQVSALSGNKAAAHQALKELQRRSYVSPWLVAIVYAELDDKERAFLWLEKAYQGREHDLAFAKVWPMFDSLRSDPRYQDLMRRVGLPE
jgi:TolB-like protein/DNA-binding winged helix-turn-helix (wHTH) protein/Flp pilus assembly protein TadD